MADDLRDFERALARFAEAEVPAALGRATRELALAALEGVVLRTPVETGLARANWRVGLDRPAAGTIDGADPDGRATIARGAAAIARARPFQAIWIANNLSYVEQLENGRSDQAPRGMVAVTVASLARGRRNPSR